MRLRGRAPWTLSAHESILVIAATVRTRVTAAVEKVTGGDDNGAGDGASDHGAGDTFGGGAVAASSGADSGCAGGAEGFVGGAGIVGAACGGGDGATGGSDGGGSGAIVEGGSGVGI